MQQFCQLFKCLTSRIRANQLGIEMKRSIVGLMVWGNDKEINGEKCVSSRVIDETLLNIIHGKLFQNNRFLEIDYAQGRDIPPGYTTKIAETLEQWVESCNTISNCIDGQITRANYEKAKSLKNKEHIEEEIINLKKVLKTQISDNDDAMQIDTRESSSMDIRRKPFKTKGGRLHNPSLGKLTGMAASTSAPNAGGNVVVVSAASDAANVTMAAANSSSSGTSWLKSFTQSFDKE
ncbi:unnamed protein product [Ceratitis capitata]|uniref:(Mediterranean fruit fly) hypothetical protein n=1 Tax=Ceratitis capitata TaxID=7213 RepID=A0A811VF69_CERCA|nr:unnamed protein product [Ceratitis capitata]